ncbi:MAG: hypothetical protein FJ090_06835 [Deltaproteobacteria bacterium]|nr:hypothetical protein [Deltaproteobacteria bacterium]
MLAALALLVSAAWADDGFSRDPEGIGMGIFLGGPTGFSAAWRPGGTWGGRFWVDGAMAWSFASFAQVHADACLDLADLRTSDIPNTHFPVWLGAGPRLRIGSGTGYDSVNLGIRVPIAMGVWHDKVPIEGWAELVPVVGVWPRTEMGFDGGIGARVYIPAGRQGPRLASPEPDPY